MAQRRMALLLGGLVLVLAVGACSLKQQADAKFGDQHFKTAIALVELYKVRHGTYPATLDELDFTGEWDAMAVHSVSYRRVEGGYELDIERGWVGTPTLAYPPQFWNGLGLKKSNAKP